MSRGTNTTRLRKSWDARLGIPSRNCTRLACSFAICCRRHLAALYKRRIDFNSLPDKHQNSVFPEARISQNAISIGVERHGIRLFTGTCERRDEKWPTGREQKMSETMAYIREAPELAEQRLWRAVIASTVEDWIYGPLHRQREAEQFLFQDQEDFHT